MMIQFMKQLIIHKLMTSIFVNKQEMLTSVKMTSAGFLNTHMDALTTAVTAARVQCSALRFRAIVFYGPDAVLLPGFTASPFPPHVLRLQPPRRPNTPLPD